MDGQSLAKRLREQTARRVEEIQRTSGVTPCLATVLVGSHAPSAVYVRMKRRGCEAVRMRSVAVEVPAEADTQRVVDEVRRLVQDSGVHGILVQHPVPAPIDRRAVFEAIPLEKDVDGVTSATLGRIILGLPAFKPCTPGGIMRLLDEYKVPLEGADAVVVGRSPILGRPMASMLINRHSTVTLCHSHTRNLPDITRRADVLIAAVGKPRFIQGDWIKSGAVVIDAGYNPGVIGDVDFDSAVKRAGMITPVPGGVGPLTIATLLEQTAEAAANQLAGP
jgi:methylenetetrahydrofolate dehydrogenase (NADP+)/methenyltetrahydrofolate cyclohydrolase